MLPSFRVCFNRRFILACLVWVCFSSFLSLSVPMNILVWNCQKAVSKRFLRAALSFIKTHKPVCFCIIEPKLSDLGADEACFKLGFDMWVRVETVGMSGGIWVMWKNSINITVRQTHRNSSFLTLV